MSVNSQVASQCVLEEGKRVLGPIAMAVCSIRETSVRGEARFGVLYRPVAGVCQG